MSGNQATDRPAVRRTAGPPRITVVTICRNALPLLERTAESVLSQGYGALEYWVIDGASTDGTREYLEALSRHGVRTLSEPDRGISDAMNKGIARATGELVAHLHAGDTYLPGALESVARGFESDPHADVFCAFMRKREERGDIVYQCDPNRLPLDMTVNHPATWTRRSTFERFGGFDGELKNVMDYDFFLRVHQAGCRFHVISEPLVAMDSGGQSERSLWVTLRETHAVRRRWLRSGWQRSEIYLAFLMSRGLARRLLQRVGLGRAVEWYRRRFALLPKG
jgi:glycosyltransferase involved in cell wall biosynthesis